MSEPVYCRPESYRAFRLEIASVDEAESLFRAAFAIALHERPEADLAEAETIIKKLTDTIRRRVHSKSVVAQLAHMHDVLFDVYGLRGNTENYYDPANSYLPDVLRSRRGIPISLVLIYKRVAESLGLAVHGINAPGHFLAEVEGGEQQQDSSMYVDPFFGGGVLDENEVELRIAQATGREPPQPLILRRATHRQWLTRMLVNLQASFTALGQERDVYAMQELQLLLE